MQLNEKIFFILHSITGQHAWLDWLMVFVADYGDMIVIFGAILFLLLHGHESLRDMAGRSRVMIQRAKEIIAFFSVSLAAWLIAAIIKNAVDAPRPFMQFPDLVTLLTHEGVYNSFPSGHATFFAALAMVIYRYHRHAGVLFGLAAIAIALSRVITGIHFPVDIVVGWLLGVLVADVITIGYRRLAQRMRGK